MRTPTRWKVDDYHQMIESGLLAGRQVELLDIRIVDIVPALPSHQVTYRRGEKYLEQLLGDRAVVFTTAPITLPTDGEPQPDICIAMPPESRYDTRHPGPGDIYWLIEVSNSTLAHDLGEKARLYARDGSQEYWMLDVAGRQLWVHRQLMAGVYGSVEQMTGGQVNPLGLSDVVVEVRRLLG